jgi:hypothetical protein
LANVAANQLPIAEFHGKTETEDTVHWALSLATSSDAAFRDLSHMVESHATIGFGYEHVWRFITTGKCHASSSVLGIVLQLLLNDNVYIGHVLSENGCEVQSYICPPTSFYFRSLLFPVFFFPPSLMTIVSPIPFSNGVWFCSRPVYRYH